jgi:predicted nucleic acid-binding protein
VLAAYRSSTDGVCYSLAPGQGVRAGPGAAMSREAIAAMPRLKELTFILDEMRRNLVEHRITAEQADRIEQAMRQAFEEAEVDRDEIERLEPAMTNDPKDRHVLAAAVAADSELIVTFDLDDFPVAACEPVGVEAIHPDQFLLDLHDLDPEAVRAALEQQAADLNPPWPLDELLRALTKAGAPRFADTVRTRR